MDFDNIMELCCACLATEPTEKLTKKTTTTYKHLTGLDLTKEFPSKVCDACDDMLKQMDVFRTICIQSYDWLVGKKQALLTKESNVNSDVIFLKVEESNDVTNDKNSIDNDEKMIVIEQGIENNKTENIESIDVEIDPLVKEENADIDNFIDTSDDDNKDEMTIDEPVIIDKENAKTKGKKEKKTVTKKITKTKSTTRVKAIKTKKDVEPKKAKKPVETEPGFIKERAPRKIKMSTINLEEYFDMKLMSKPEQIIEFEERKNSDKYTTRTHKCEKCYKAFNDAESFKTHLLVHTVDNKPYECDICQFRFTNKKTCCQHRGRHKYKYTCKMCKFKTIDRHTATLHMRWHMGKKYRCEQCNLTFTRIQGQLLHFRTKHPSNNVCGICGYSFIGEHGLKLHIKFKHGVNELSLDGPKCDECKITFANDEALSAHKTERHGVQKSKPTKYNTEQVTCEQCGEVSPSRHAYRYHFNTYHSNSTITQYSQNMNTQLCFICGKTFPNYKSLTIHLSRHEIPGEQHTCDICNEVFNTKIKYQTHKLLHEGKNYNYKESGYPCPICAKVFFSNSNLHRHRKVVHSTVKGYKCDFCEKTFKGKAERKAHQDHVHFKKAYKKRNRNRKFGKDDSN